jgi:hypothetical protein
MRYWRLCFPARYREAHGKLCGMAIHLSESEIRLLKELKGAGERGRLISGAAPRAGLARLVKAAYVTERAVSLDAVMYVITAMGLHALTDILIEGG